MKGANLPAVRFVAQVALREYRSLSAPERIQLLEGLAQILPSNEAKAAKQTSWMLKKSEEHQMRFQELFTQGGNKS